MNLKGKAYSILSYIWESVRGVSLPTLGDVSQWTEYAAFAALAGAILALAAKGIGVAFGFIGLLVAGALIEAFVGLLITFLALLVLSILLDGGHEYRQFVRDQLEDDEDVQDFQQQV